MTKIVSIGAGAGFADERPDAVQPVVADLAARTGPRYVIFETLAERTLALAQLARRADPGAGYTPQLAGFLTPIIRQCKQAGIGIVANFGAANPTGAARRILAIARDAGITNLRVAVVSGDDIKDTLGEDRIRCLPVTDGLPMGDQPILAANVYLGARPIAEALAYGVDVVVTGRCTDSALVLGPLIHEFGWAEDDWDRLATGTLLGHLLECSAQVSGGYFADPGYKDVPNLAQVGLPIGEVDEDGNLAITKAAGTGGQVSAATVKEQLIYEIHDPAHYIVPDVVLDVTGVTIAESEPDRVLVRGARGKPRTPTLKATISVEGGWLAEGEISYCGPNALARAELAGQVLAERLRIVGIQCPTRIDIVGTLSTFDSDRSALRNARSFPPDGDYRVRLSGNAPDKHTAERIANEVIGLYSTGPAGGGGVRKAVTSRVRTCSVLVDRTAVATDILLFEGEAP
ncbi:MAG: DUF1446 domain-containing protein [Burkholderiales bacterium]|nr:DUF1446 domain-containing protein [Burkholderiales bacterium]